jgi:hypothetical protein
MADPERLLALYRDASGPTTAAQQRMLATLHVKLGSGATTGGAATSGGTTATVGASLASKLVVVVIAASSVAALVVGARSRDHELALVDADERPALVEPAPTSAPVPPPVPVPPALEPASLEPAVASLPHVSEPALERARTRDRSRRRTKSASVDEGSLADEGLASEAKLLREADAALRRGAPAEARQLLDDHARRFGQPSLADEAELLARLLDCQDGRPDADTLARRYLDAHPNSPAAARIAAKCTLE